MGGPVLECLFGVMFFGYVIVNIIVGIKACFSYFECDERECFPTRGTMIFLAYPITMMILKFCLTPRKKK